MVTCAICGRIFSNERSLNSHKAWHSGILKSWKNAADIRDNPPSSKAWSKNGRDLIRGFLAGVLPAYELSPEDRVDLVEKIWALIDKSCAKKKAVL